MTTVIGVGSAHGDDVAGLLVAHRLRQLRPDLDIRTIEEGTVPLLEVWSGLADVIIVDTARTGSRPGVVHRVAVHEGQRLSSAGGSHGRDVDQAVEAGRVLHALPSRLVVFSIEGHWFSSSAGVSAEVVRAADEAAHRVLVEMGAAAAAS